MIAARRGAQGTDFVFAEVVAVSAVTDTVKRRTQRLGNLAGAVAIASQQVKGHALCGFRPYAGQTPQRLLKAFDGG
jgi:hypothetical protein